MTHARVLVAVLSLGACYDGRGREGGLDTAADGDDVPAPESVELSGVRDLERECVRLQADEAILSISTRGDLWLGSANVEGTKIRVIASEGEEVEFLSALSVEQLQGWNATQAVLLAGDRLWLGGREGFAVLTWPTTIAPPQHFCGQPQSDGGGFVLTKDGQLYHRDAGSWWHWTAPGGASFGSIARLVSSYGACVGRDSALWMLGSDGRVWRVSADDARSVPSLAGASALGIDATFGAAGLVGNRLILGDPQRGWTEAVFDALASEPPLLRTLAVSAGRLWLATSAGLLLLEDGQWFEVTSGGQVLDSIDVGELWADGQHAWILEEEDESGGRNVCRLGSLGVVVDGFYPLQRVDEAALSFIVTGARQPGELHVTVDGELREVAAPSFPVSLTVDLGEPGWHHIEVIVSDDRSSADIELRRPQIGTWLDDVQPIAELHCATAGCHDAASAGERPMLSDYEVWVEYAEAIAQRVGVTADMPPAAVRRDTWSAQEVNLILAWIAGGMPYTSE